MLSFLKTRIGNERTTIMKISACVITRNEEKNLPTCLDSVKYVVSEIIVVDTGSTDQTIAVAKRFGAKVFKFEWIDDFSAARNFAISKASGDWIIFLDADEYFAPECVPYLHGVIKEAHSRNLDMVICLLANIEKTTKKILNTVPHIRIFKNHPQIRYVSPIHERIVRLDRPAQALDVQKDVTIIHTGYSEEDVKGKDKGQRNLQLLFKALEKNPNRSDLCFYISESLLLERDFEQALSYAYKVIEYNNSELKGSYEKNYVNIINCLIQLERPKEQLLQIINEAIRRFPEFPDFRFYLGDHYKREHRYMDALEAYQEGIRLLDNQSFSQSSALATATKVLDTMGYLFSKTRQWSRCVETHVKVLQIDKYYYSSLVNLLLVLTKFENVDIIFGFLVKLYDLSNKKDCLLLLKAALDIKNIEIASKMFLQFSGQESLLKEELATYHSLAGDQLSSSKLFSELYTETGKEEYAYRAFVAAWLSRDTRVMELVDSMLRSNSSIQKLTKKAMGLSAESASLPIEKHEVIRLIDSISSLSHHVDAEKLIALLEDKNLLFVAADSLYYREHYKVAYELFNAYLEQNDEVAQDLLSDLTFKVGYCLFEEEKVEHADFFMRKAQQLNPTDYRIYATCIAIGQHLQDYDYLKATVSTARQYFPDSQYFRSLQDQLK